MTEKDLTAENDQLDPQSEITGENTVDPESSGSDTTKDEPVEQDNAPDENSVTAESDEDKPEAGETKEPEVLIEKTEAGKTIPEPEDSDPMEPEVSLEEPATGETIPEVEAAETNEPEGSSVEPAGETVPEHKTEETISEPEAVEIKSEESRDEAGDSAEQPAAVVEEVPEKKEDEDKTEPVTGEKRKAVQHDEELVRQLNDESSNQETDDDEDEEESDVSDEDHEIAPERFDEYTRPHLLELLEITVAEQNIQKIKSRVAMIKVAFLKLTRNEEQDRFQKYIEDGGDKESYSPEQDELTEKFNQVFDIYRKNKIKFNEEQEVLKLRNLDAKKQILEDLKELINSEDSLKKTYDQFKELQNSWKEIGLVPANEINNLWQSYHFLVEKFFDKVKISRELRDLDLKKNLDLKIELCEKAEELLLETSIVKSFKQLQKYHEEWKEIGPVPAEKRDEIWERFKTATDKINERRREYYTNIAGQQESNLLAKKAICEKAEELISEEANTIKGWQQKTDGINELFNLWKSIGPAPKKENDEIWERFKNCLNTFFSNKKEYFNQLKQEQINNYNIKLDIVKQAEALKDSTEWKKTTQDLINLQKEWRNIGPVPRKYSDKIWKRFRAACDEFFKKKSEYFSNIGEIESQNLQKKLDLIKKVREQKFSGDKNDNLDIIKELQREWMDIGHVPIKEKDKVQQAFREAINKHLDNLNISVVEVKEMDYQTHLENIKDGPNSNRILRKEMGFLSGKISKLREEIHLWENNIGFLAHSKRADLLRKEFEEKIEKAKEELALSEAKLRMLQESGD